LKKPTEEEAEEEICFEEGKEEEILLDSENETEADDKSDPNLVKRESKPIYDKECKHTKKSKCLLP